MDTINDFLKKRGYWSIVGNINLCEIDGCFKPSTDFIEVSDGPSRDIYYFCHVHFMELLHKKINLSGEYMK